LNTRLMPVTLFVIGLLSVSALAQHKLTVREGYQTLFYDGKPFFAVSNRWGDELFDKFCEEAGGNFRNLEYFALCPFLQEDLKFSPQRIQQMDDIVLSMLRRGIPVRISLSHAHGDIPVPPHIAEKLGLPEPKRLSNVGYSFTFLRPEARRLALKEARLKAERYRSKDVMFMIGVETDRVFLHREVITYREKNILSEWSEWLRREFNGDIASLRDYLKVDAASFDAVPYPQALDWNDERFGLPARAIELKQRFLFDRWCDFLNAEKKVIKEADAQHLTCHKITTHFAPEHFRKAPVDMWMVSGRFFGDMSSEPIYMKPWYGIYYTQYPLHAPKVVKMGIFDPTNPHFPHGTRTRPDGRQLCNIFYTNLACGASAFEEWLEQRPPDGMFEWGEEEWRLTPYGAVAAMLFQRGKELAPFLLHYRRDAQIAVYSNEFYTLESFHLRQHNLMSKIGAWGLLRELGFDFDALTRWDILNGGLSRYKVLLLAGELSLTPPVQEAIRKFVEEGGTLICSFDGRGRGFAGANSYDYSGSPLQSIEKANFYEPPSVAHLGDVLGVRTGGGEGKYRRLVFVRPFGEWHKGDAVSLDEVWTAYEALRWKLSKGRYPLTVALVCERLQSLPQAKVIARFADDSGQVRTAAIVANRFGEGIAYTFGFNLGAVAMLSYNPIAFSLMESLLVKAGCRRPVRFDNYRVECGVWEDDAGRKTVILVNHERKSAQSGALLVEKSDTSYDIFTGDNEIDAEECLTRHRVSLPAFGSQVLQTVALVNASSPLTVTAQQSSSEISFEVNSHQSQRIRLLVLSRNDMKVERISAVGSSKVESKPHQLGYLFDIRVEAWQPVRIALAGAVAPPAKSARNLHVYTFTAELQSNEPTARGIPLRMTIENKGIVPLDLSWRLELPEGIDCPDGAGVVKALAPSAKREINLLARSATKDAIIGVAVASVTARYRDAELTKRYKARISNCVNYALASRGARATARNYLKRGDKPWVAHSYPPGQAIDGIISRTRENRWHSDLTTGAPFWLRITLPEERTIRAVAIYPPRNVYIRNVPNYIEDFSLQYSTDGGKTWREIFTEKGFKGKEYFRKFEPVRARDFRLFITKSRNPHYTQIAEIELYGQP